MPAYESYFDNFFLNLPMSRVNFKKLGTDASASVKQLGLGKLFDGLTAEVDAAANDLDTSIGESGTSTKGGTEAFRTMRKAWLLFVDDVMKDSVTPKLRKLPAYADFKQYSKSKLAVLPQPRLLQESKNLLRLYGEHQAALGRPTLQADAQAAYQRLADTDEARVQTNAAIDGAVVAAAQDWVRLARALRRLKGLLEYTFDDPADVYRHFDFAKARGTKSKAAKARA